MVIIHKERVSVPVTEMRPGTVFFNHCGDLLIVTDDIDSVDNVVTCVNLKNGNTFPYYKNDIAQPLEISMLEVK